MKARRFIPAPVYIIADVGYEHHGALVLFLVRQRLVHNWESLCHAFHFDPAQAHSGHYGLRQTVENLIAAGLLTSATGTYGPYKVAGNWETIQRALGISLAQAANLRYYDSVAVTPIFGQPRRLRVAPHIFLAMPFDRKLDPVYRVIRAVARDLRVTVERADDIFSASKVITDIWDRIFNAGIVIADCTGRNPNVFYEITHGARRPILGN